MLASEFDRAVELITGASELALACHMSPDGDALGSLLALLELANVNGKPAVASWSEPFEVGHHYRFLPGLDQAVKPADFPDHPGVMMTFDCGSIDRLGQLADTARAADELIVVDHHATNDSYGTVNLIDPDAAATAVLVRKLAARLDWALTRDAAICLYTGLVTDTGRFQYSNTTTEVFALAEELSTFDLPIASMSRQLFEEHRFEYLQLVGECIARAQLDEHLHFVASWVTQDDLRAHGVRLEETEGLIDLVRRAAEAEVSCVLKETPDGIRVSLRAASTADVASLAGRFGGGGHRYAAGFVAPGTIEEVLAAIRSALAEDPPPAPAA
ncbi:MAG: DHH family phosphoesterase [Actinomycetota bacterium]